MLTSPVVAFLTALRLDEAREIAASYGLSVQSIEPFAGGSVNSNFCLSLEDGRRLFLRVYEEQNRDGAFAELELVSELGRKGVPTPAPLARGDGTFLSEHRQKPVALFPWIEGEVLCQKRVTALHAEKLGAALAAVHLAGVEAHSEGRFSPAALESRLSRIERDSPAHQEDARRIRALVSSYLPRREALPSGLVHGDLFRDNVLWDDGELVALIDFESASRGTFVYDLAVCVHAWCYGDSFDLELVRALVSGYTEKRRLSDAERAAFSVEAALAALRFAVTRITDYAMRAPEGQAPLRDYRRFLARLQAVEAGALAAAL